MKQLIVILFSISIYAKLPWGTLENVNASYSSPEGLASAKYLNLEDVGEFHNPELNVVNEAGVLVFSYEDKKFDLDLTMFSVQDAERVNIQNLNLINNNEKINLNFESIYANAIDMDARIYNVDFDCKREKIHDDMIGDLFETCFTNAKIKFKRFEYYEDKRNFNNFIVESSKSDKVIVKNISINVKNERFDGSLESNLTFGIDVRYNGKAKYFPKERMIELKVEEVKASLFSIRSKVFDVLKDSVPDNIIVDEPYIKVYLP